MIIIKLLNLAVINNLTSVNFDTQDQRFIELSQRWGISATPDALFQLRFVDETLTLFKLDEPKLGGVFVDFTTGAVAHRRKFGGGRGQAIAKAIGLKQGVTPTVVDGTAGLGRDAFVLASLNCNVSLIERHPVVAALLEDGLSRGYQDSEIGHWLQEKMQLLPKQSLESLLTTTEQPDVVYLDPMYPHKEKSALVKKEMRVFQTLVGADIDADDLLEPALALAGKRVVVKRPDYAPPLANHKPNLTIEMKKHRFDVYTKATMFSPK